MSPILQVYTKMKQISEARGYDTYDTIPPAKVNYPYVFLGEKSKQNFRVHKDGYNRRVQMTLHIWHNNKRQLGTFLNVMEDLEEGIIEEFGVDGEDISVGVIDDPTNTNLIHGIIDTNITI